MRNSIFYSWLILFQACALGSISECFALDGAEGYGPKAACLLARLHSLDSENNPKLRFEGKTQIPTISYEENARPPESFKKYDSPNVNVREGKFEEVSPGVTAISNGFRICNAVLIRNSKSGRLVVYHYWEAADYNFSRLDGLIKTFEPETLEVVVFGNHASTSFDVMERYLSRRVRKIKSYRVQEFGRWEFQYKQDSDEILYHNTDNKHVAVIKNVFGKKAAKNSYRRMPEFDRRLNALNIQREIDSITEKLSYLLNDVSPPERLSYLPTSEMDLRILRIKKYRELIKVLPPGSSEMKDAENAILRFKEVVKRLRANHGRE